MLLFILGLITGNTSLNSFGAEIDQWREKARPIFQTYCNSCHQSYSSFSNVERDAEKILQRIDPSPRNSMPPLNSILRANFDRNPELRSTLKSYMALVKDSPPLEKPGLFLDRIKMPTGFRISLYAIVPGARSMAISPDGTLFVGSGGLGGAFKRVYAVRDLDQNGSGEEVTILADGLDTPNGVAFKNGDLYVAEISRILVLKNVTKNIAPNRSFSTFVGGFPTDRHHGWKFIRFAPDGSLFVPVGAHCNICSKEETHAGIFRVSADGQTKAMVAKGVRNTVGFDFNPLNGDFLFTENGRDGMGDTIPPEEINALPADDWKRNRSLHYGFPFCHGGSIVDPEFGASRSCSEFTSPILKLPAHVAPLGLRFYRGSSFPPDYRNSAFVAEHGSWNRSKPDGYRVSIAVQTNGTWKYRPFASGWLNSDGTRWGRPVDVENAPDGSIYVSDDFAGVIYKLEFKGN